MILLLALIPWVLTVGALFFIIVKSDRYEEMDDEDFETDDREVVKVAVYEDKAYWVYGNVFYESDITREPDFETARPIDTMRLAPKELNRLLTILDELQEETERD
jgi:hypothetical protein